jgi:hypothetical protein
MRICKIKDGKPVSATIKELRKENKGVSFPNEPAESTLAKFGYYIINETDKPDYNADTQTIEASLVLEAGVVSEVWAVVEMDPSVVAESVIYNATERRREVERGGTEWVDSNGKRYLIGTDLNSQQKTVGQLAMITHGIATGVQHWKLESVEDGKPEFRPTTHAEFKSIATAMKEHIEKSFAAEAIVIHMAGLGVYTDFDTEFAKL